METLSRRNFGKGAVAALAVTATAGVTGLTLVLGDGSARAFDLVHDDSVKVWVGAGERFTVSDAPSTVVPSSAATTTSRTTGGGGIGFSAGSPATRVAGLAQAAATSASINIDKGSRRIVLQRTGHGSRDRADTARE